MKDSKFNSIQSNKVLIFVELFLNYFPAVLIFLMPLFFLTIFTDFYNQSKYVLFLMGTVFMTLFWVLKLLLRKKVSITKSKLDLPIWFHLIVAVVSTVFSVSQLDSIYGTQYNWLQSLITVITFVLYFYTIASNIRSLQAIKFAIYGLVFSGTIVSMITILYYYGIRFGSEAFLQIRNFTPAGSIENVSLLATLAFLLSFSIILNTKDVKNKVASGISLTINLVLITITMQLASIVLLAVGVIYIIFNVSSFKKVKNEILATAILASIWIFAFYFPVTSSFLQRPSLPTEQLLDLRSSWVITARTLTERPIWGAGMGNFSKFFLQFRPLELNTSMYADVNFQNPFNQAFQDLIALGLLGAIAGIFFYYKLADIVIDLYKKKGELTPIHQALLIPIVGIGIYHLLSVGTLVSFFMFYTFLGIFIGLIAGFHKNKSSEDIFLSVTSFSSVEISDAPEGKEKFQYFAMIPLLGIAGAISYYSYFNVAGEYYFRQAINSALRNDAYGVYNNQILARNVFPRRDSYHSAIAQTNLSLALSIARNPNLTEQERQAVSDLMSEAIRSTRLATENLGSYNIDNWVVRATVYRALIGATQDGLQWAVAALNNAITLDPTNANLRLDLGSLYFSQNDFVTAANLFRQATELRYNLANAHYNLAQALKGAQVKDLALRELEVTKSLLSAESPDMAMLDNEIATLRKELESVAGASTEKKSVEQIENSKTTSASQTTPLTKPEEVTKDAQVLEKAVGQ